ncbi:hypothetical protein KR215_002061, partial [Drosophila sulfurigaster]
IGWRRSVLKFLQQPSVQYAQVTLVVVGDILSLASLYPSHSMHISRPFLLWK